uniref:Uncharacterized protein n=1 Tax=Heterosigma akashiwo TaxID=2829 RepID=A0A7S3USG9_HETAK
MGQNGSSREEALDPEFDLRKFSVPSRRAVNQSLFVACGNYGNALHLRDNPFAIHRLLEEKKKPNDHGRCITARYSQGRSYEFTFTFPDKTLLQELEDSIRNAPFEPIILCVPSRPRSQNERPGESTFERSILFSAPTTTGSGTENFMDIPLLLVIEKQFFEEYMEKTKPIRRNDRKVFFLVLNEENRGVSWARQATKSFLECFQTNQMHGSNLSTLWMDDDVKNFKLRPVKSKAKYSQWPDMDGITCLRKLIRLRTELREAPNGVDASIVALRSPRHLRFFKEPKHFIAYSVAIDFQCALMTLNDTTKQASFLPRQQRQQHRAYWEHLISEKKRDRVVQHCYFQGEDFRLCEQLVDEKKRPTTIFANYYFLDEINGPGAAETEKKQKINLTEEPAFADIQIPAWLYDVFYGVKQKKDGKKHSKPDCRYIKNPRCRVDVLSPGEADAREPCTECCKECVVDYGEVCSYYKAVRGTVFHTDQVCAGKGLLPIQSGSVEELAGLKPCRICATDCPQPWYGVEKGGKKT